MRQPYVRTLDQVKVASAPEPASVLPHRQLFRFHQPFKPGNYR
jgi:hypothetical protein